METKGTVLGVRAMEVELEILSILVAPGPSKLSPFVANIENIRPCLSLGKKRYFMCFCWW